MASAGFDCDGGHGAISTSHHATGLPGTPITRTTHRVLAKIIRQLAPTLGEAFSYQFGTDLLGAGGHVLHPYFNTI